MKIKLMKGPKGGQYYLDENGNKQYVRKTKSSKTEIPSTQYSYTISITKKVNGVYDSTFSEVVKASSKSKALGKIKEKYKNTDTRSYKFIISGIN